jgi:hypothetical protein
MLDPVPGTGLALKMQSILAPKGSHMIHNVSNQPTNSERKSGALAIEKRRHPRYVVELPLDYSRADAGEVLGGIAANASEGGLLVYLPERMDVGTLLKIEILYVKGLELNTIKAVGEVVWVDLAARESYGEHRYGLHFESISEEDFARLKALLREIGK